MRWIGVALIAASFLIPPFFAGDFYVNLASQILIAAIFALSLNLLVGFGGMTSLGHASYLGVAAFGCRIQVAEEDLDQARGVLEVGQD